MYSSSGENFEAEVVQVNPGDSCSDKHGACDIIRYNKSFLAEELDANVYIEYLYKKGHLSDEERISIVQGESRQRNMMTLLTGILSKSSIAAEDFLNEVEKCANDFLRRRLRPERVKGTLYLANHLMDVFPDVINVLPIRVITHELQDWPIPADLEQFLKKDVPRKTKALATVQYVLASDEIIRCRFVQILRDKDLVPNAVLLQADKNASKDHTSPWKSGVNHGTLFLLGHFRVNCNSNSSRNQRSLGESENDYDAGQREWYHCFTSILNRLFPTNQHIKRSTSEQSIISADSGYKSTLNPFEITGSNTSASRRVSYLSGRHPYKGDAKNKRV